MSTDSFLARSLRWSVHTDATFMLMAHDICTRVSRAPREGCVFACVCVEILNDAAHFFFGVRSQRAAFRCGTSLLPVVHFCWTLALVCWRDAVQNSTLLAQLLHFLVFFFFIFSDMFHINSNVSSLQQVHPRGRRCVWAGEQTVFYHGGNVFKHQQIWN